MTAKTKLDEDVCTIVVVDVQNDFCSPDGQMARAGADVTPVVAMVPRLAALLADARAAGVPIVWVQTWRDEWTESAVWRARKSLLLDPPADEVPTPNCVKGTWGAEFYEVGPEPGEPLVRKARFGAFTGTELDAVLRTIARPSLLLTGVATNVCVDSTLREALFREYHVTLVEDCCASPDVAGHAATVETVRRCFGVVVTSDQAARAWGRQPAVTA